MGKKVVEGECALCKEHSFLLSSHIIPHALLRISRGASPQMVLMPTASDKPPRMGSANWTEPLLCEVCERLLNLRYESSGISKLKGKKIQHDSRFTIQGFEFDRFYLFWLSIFWRAATSRLEHFNTVELSDELLEVCRSAILSGGLNNGITDFIRIGVLRLELPTEFGDSREVMTNFVRFDEPDAIQYVLVVAGLAVVFQVSATPFRSLPEGFSLVKKSFVYRLNKVSPEKSKILASIFILAIEYARRNTGFDPFSKGKNK